MLWNPTGMLSPEERTLLVDLLAPPAPGYRLEHAVATTFTLHLTALLPLPLGLAGADLSASTDPLSILQAIRNYADLVDVFCQAGHVAVPAQRNDLLAFLEPMVHQVKAPRPGHLFHPKLWILRFLHDDGSERFRLVCGSRNLTHDRAWDAVISLEGDRTLQPRRRNRPLAELIASLPGRVAAGVPDARARRIAELADAIRYVGWEPLDNTFADGDWLTFHVLDGRRARPNMTGYSRLIVTPFLNDEGLDHVWPDGEGKCVLLSRGEELNALGADWREWVTDRADLRALDDNAAIPDPESEEAGLRWSLSGLHAKLYIVERNRRAHIFIGSANATDAGWSGNDEVLVEIVGRTSAFGVDAAIGPSGLGRILVPHVFGDAADETPEEELRRTFENALRDLSSLTYTATVEGDHETPLLWVRSDEPLRRSSAVPRGTELTVELLTLTGQPHRPAFESRLDHRWQLSEVEEITPFLVLRLGYGTGSSRIEASSVVLARLVGDPNDRLDRVLARRIGSTSEFLRFILLLLQLAGRDDWLPEGDGLGSFASFAVGDSAGVLEAVLGTLATSPRMIDDIDRLVARLSASEQGRKVLPDDWNEFWPSVVTARERLGRRR
jgi:PLD-like domain